MRKSTRSVGHTTHTGGVDETIPTGGVAVTIPPGVDETIPTGVDDTIPTGVDERVQLLKLLKDELLDAELEEVRLTLSAKRLANSIKRAAIEQQEARMNRPDQDTSSSDQATVLIDDDGSYECDTRSQFTTHGVAVNKALASYNRFSRSYSQIH